MPTVQRFIEEESGATAIEYGLIAALVSVSIILALNFLASQLNATFNKVSTSMSGAIASSK